MRKKYESIIALGTKNSFSNNLNKKIRLLNTYCIIWSHIVLFFYSLELIIGLVIETINQTTITFSFFNLHSFFTYFFILSSVITTLFLNKSFHFKWGRFVFISTVIIVNVYASLITTPGNYIEYYFIELVI